MRALARTIDATGAIGLRCLGLTVAYEIVSDVDNGRITAKVEMPSRNPPKSVLLRFRHPESAPIKSVEVNGKPWRDFDPVKEAVKLHDLTGSASVVVDYR